MSDRRSGRRLLEAGAVVAAGAGVWLLSAGEPFGVRALMVLLVAVLPAASLKQGRMLREMELEQVPRAALYLSTSLTLWLLAGITLAVALLSGWSTVRLGLVALPLVPLVVWSALLTAVALLMIAAGRVLRLRETPFVHHLLPRTRGERLAFVGVSVSAGVCEELVFRGFLIPALAAAFGSLALAVVASSAVFGLLHGYQGITGIVRTALLGALLAVPLITTGSILPAVIAHFAIDLVVGLWLADWLRGAPPAREPVPV